MKTIQLDVGAVFGRWTVLGEGVQVGTGKCWRCRCECGRERDVLSVRLRQGKSLSCGCLNIERSAAAKWKGVGDLSHTHWTTVIAGARQRGFTVDLTIHEAWELFKEQRGLCALTGITLTMFSYTDAPTTPARGGTTGRRTNGTASLDRIDSSRGYVKGNVQWVHKVVNTMKLDHDQKEFIKWCDLVVKHSKRGDNNLTVTKSS